MASSEPCVPINWDRKTFFSDIFMDDGSIESVDDSPANSNMKCGEGARKSKVDQAGCRVAFRTKSELAVMDDGFKWRNYGKKMVVIKNSTNPRNYYKCASMGCNVKKRVERDSEDPSYLITTYDGVHNHERPCVVYYNQTPLMVPNGWTLHPPPSQSFFPLCRGDILVSNWEEKNTREVPKRQGMAESVLSFVNSTRCISSTDFDAPANSPHLGSAHQSGPIVFNSEKKDTMEGLNKECLTKSLLSLDDSTKQVAIKDFYEGKDSCASNSSEKPGNQVDSCGSVGGGRNNQAVLRSESFVETCILSLSAASAPSANDSEIDKLWHYRDPNGKIQGPFCVVQLHKWSTTGYFPPEMRIWHINNEEVDSVLLTDLLSGKLRKVFPLQSNNSLPSKGVVARGGGRLNCFDDRSCGSVNTTGMDGNKVLGPYVCDNESVNSDGWGSQSSNWTAPVNNEKSRWAKLRFLWKAVRAFAATAKEFRCANAKVNFLLVEENSRNPDVKSNCNQSLGTLTTVESSIRDDCAGIPPDLNTRKRSSWANLRLLWKAARAFAATKEFRGANAEVDFPLVEENKNLDIKKGNCNQSSSIVTTVELSSRDDIAEMLPDLKTSKYASSSCGPIGLQDGDHIWLLDPLEQSTKNVAHAARADPCSLTASLPEKKMVRTLKRKYRIISVMFKNHRQHFGRRFEGAVKSFHAMRICRKHGINRVSRVKHIHKQHGIQQWPFRQKWATRKGYSSGDERLLEVSSLSMDEKLDPGLLFIRMSKFARSSPQTLALPDGGEIVTPIASSPSEFVGTNNRPHLVRQDQSGSTASHYERTNTRGTSERQGITTNSCGVEDLQQHFGCKHKDAVKRLDVSISMFKRTCRQHRGYWWPCQIDNNDSIARKPFKERHESRFHKLNYLARKLFEVLDGFPPWVQSDNIRHLVRQRRLALKHWVRVKKSQDLSQTLQMNCSGSLTAQSASSLHWPISLPDGGRILSLLEKKTMKKTLKRKCSAMGVSFEDHQQHFCSRCECAANRLGAKPIYEQHGINLVSTVKRIRGQYGILRRTFRKGYSFGGQRPAGVLSLSTEVKLVSRLQFFHMSWLARSSRYPLALRSGSQISGHIAFSSSEFPATNNGAHRGRQDQCGSSASRLEKKRGRETKDGEGENNTISRKDLEQHFGKKREEVANLFGISVSTLKRICRKHGISEWPNRRRNSGNSFPSIQRICREQRIPPWPDWRSNPVFIPPDPNGEKNPSPTFDTLSTNGQIMREIEMGGLNSEPNECLPDSFEDPNFQNIGNCSIAEFENPTTFHDSHHGHCSDADFYFSAVYNGTEAAGGSGYILEQVSESSNFTFPAYFDAAAPIQPVPPILHPMPHPPIASTQIPRENMGSFEDRTNLLAPQKESLPAGSSISDLALSQAMHTTPHTTESSEYWRETLASVVGHLMGSQPVPTNPHMTPLLTERQDSMFVKLNATYGEDPINLYLPLMPGIMELKQAVSKQLGLGLDIFKVMYENERRKWILMTHDEDVRELLRLTSSENHDSNRLVVIKVPNTSDFCGNCECDKCRSLKGKKP